jgi:hypothetical protein
MAVSPDSGAGNAVITVTGSHLSDIKSVVLDNGNVPINFNPNFNTDEAAIFSIPTNANVGTQHIVFTNSAGYQWSIPFTVLAVPSIKSAFPTEWEAGNTIAVSGNYLDGVFHVGLASGTSPDDTATIVSATPTQLVIQMPASSVPSSKLVLYNVAGATVSSFTLINMDQQLKMFTDDYGPGMQDWSWCSSSKSTDFAVSGTTSLKEGFSSGGSQGLSFHWDDTITTNLYTTLSFWVKGGSADNTIGIFPDGVISGSNTGKFNVQVPAGVWTHVSVPISTNWSGVTCQRFDFQIAGPDSDQTLYFDNVILIKQ